MSTRRWAYAAVGGWAMAMAGAGLVFGLSFCQSWAWLVAGLLVALTCVVAAVAALAVWALVGEV